MARTPRVSELRGPELRELLAGENVTLHRSGRTLHLTPWCRPGAYPVKVALPEIGTYRMCDGCLPENSPEVKRLAQAKLAELAAEELLELGAHGELRRADDLYDRLMTQLVHDPGSVNREKLQHALRTTKDWWSKWTEGDLPAGPRRVMLLGAEVPQGGAIALLAAGTRIRQERRRVVVVPTEYRNILEYSAGGSDAGEYREDSDAVLETALTLWADNGDVGAPEALERARLVHG